MQKVDQEYLENTFGDLINYDENEPLQPVNPITYLTPEGDSCLHIAAGRGDMRAVVLLVDAGVDVNLRGDLGNTPLHYASHGRHYDIAEFLIDRGASPDIINKFGESAFCKCPE